MVAGPERKGEVNQGRGRGRGAGLSSTRAHRQPRPPALRSRASSTASSGRRSLSRPRRTHSLSPIRLREAAPRPRPGPISAPGGRTCKVPTCTCGRRGRLPRCCFFVLLLLFSFPLPLGSGGLNHLANDQQVGRCPRDRRVGRASASKRAAEVPSPGGSRAVRAGERDAPENARLLS